MRCGKLWLCTGRLWHNTDVERCAGKLKYGPIFLTSCVLASPTGVGEGNGGVILTSHQVEGREVVLLESVKGGEPEIASLGLALREPISFTSPNR
jgi:hypothetical protein